MTEIIKRNDPCHCGSGRKYKNCCLEKDESSFSSKLGMIGLIIAVLLGFWLLGSALFSDNVTQDCPEGTTWSETHQHCH